MLRPRLLCALLSVMVAVAIPAIGQQRVWTETGEPVSGWEFVDEGVRAFMEQWTIPGAVMAVTFEGRLIFARGYTWDSPGTEPIQPTSLFRIASMSKPVTSVAIHQLIERGLLTYETRIVDVLDLQPMPGMERDERLEDVTIDHLLYHVGGWDRDLTFDPMFYDEVIADELGVGLPISKADIMTYMSGQPLQFDPGSRYAYSNYGYCLLGMVIEEVTGRNYSEWVAENVFQLIGVGRPRRGHTSMLERSPGEVIYHGTNGEDPYRWNIENMDAHGGWVLSGPDYARFMSSLFDDLDNSPLLTRESIEEMMEFNPVTRGFSYARGWEVLEDGDAREYGHGGSLPGTLASARWASNGLCVVALINTRTYTDDLVLGDPTANPPHDLFESVGITGDRLGAALAESWIPVVSSVNGSGGSVWRSDVGLLNRSSLTNLVRVRLEMQGLVVDREYEMDPGEHLILDDVVGETGLNGSGSLRVFSFEPLTIASRTYNVSEDGTFGQFLGGVTGPGSLMNGETAVLMHLREDEMGRSNIGILNGGRRSARVEIVLFDGSGLEVGRTIKSVAPRQIKQLNRPFESIAGRTDIGSGYAVVTVVQGEEVVAYGSVVDAGTNDPTTIPMKTGSGATETHVAAAARGEGAAGSLWRTDLGLLNPGETSTETSVIFHSSDGTDMLTVLTLDSGEHLVLEDVVGYIGGEGSGSLEILADRPIMVSSRTYNLSENGTFGQYIDGLDFAHMVAAPTSVWLPQLQQNEDFRTNIGLFNSDSDQVHVKVHLYDADGSLLSTTERNIPAGGRIQLQEPFDRIAGRTDILSGYAVVEVTTGIGVTVYASVVDNRTNDPTTVAMVR